MKEKQLRDFGCQVSALWLSWQAESILEDMGEDFESIDEMDSEAVEWRTGCFFSSYGAFEYLSGHEISDWDDAIEEGYTDVISIASYYLKDEVMSGLAKLKKTMGGKNNG